MGFVLPYSNPRHRLLQGGRARPNLRRLPSSLCSDVHPVPGVDPCDCLWLFPSDRGAANCGLLHEKELDDLSGEMCESLHTRYDMLSFKYVSWVYVRNATGICC